MLDVQGQCVGPQNSPISEKKAKKVHKIPVLCEIPDSDPDIVENIAGTGGKDADSFLSLKKSMPDIQKCGGLAKGSKNHQKFTSKVRLFLSGDLFQKNLLPFFSFIFFLELLKLILSFLPSYLPSILFSMLVMYTIFSLRVEIKALWGAGVRIAAAVRAKYNNSVGLPPQSLADESFFVDEGIIDLSSEVGDWEPLNFTKMRLNKKGTSWVIDSDSCNPLSDEVGYDGMAKLGEDKGGESDILVEQHSQVPVTLHELGSFPPNFRTPT